MGVTVDWKWVNWGCFGLVGLVFLGQLNGDVSANASQVSLPKFALPDEPEANQAPDASEAPPSFDSLKVPPEYSTQLAVVLSWKADFSFLGNIARAAGEISDMQIWAVGGPEKAPKGVLQKNYRSIDCDVDTMWMRDFGPIGFFQNGQGGATTLGLSDVYYRLYRTRAYDDSVPTCMGGRLNLPVVKSGFVMDGGNFMVDSQGTLFTTKRTFKWNSNLTTEQMHLALENAYGVNRVVELPYAGYPGQPTDGTGHVDMFAKLLDDKTILISETKSSPYKEVMEETVEIFKSLVAPGGEPYRILRVPAFLDDNDTWHTYTNSLLLNGTALVPSYSEHLEHNKHVEQMYNSAGYEVKFIPSDDSIQLGGSIHCVTQNIPSLVSK